MLNSRALKGRKEITRAESVKINTVHDKWNKKCCFQGCPLKVAMDTADGQTCGLHFQSAFPGAVTHAIKENIKYFTIYAKILRWSEEDWRKNQNYLENMPFKMKQEEHRSIFLKNFFSWINEKVRSEASEKI